jgi:hypothetical protein
LDRYSQSPATEADSGGSPARQHDGSSVGVEVVELADDEGKLEIVDQHEDDENEEDNDGGKTPLVGSTAVQDSNKKDQLDTGEKNHLSVFCVQQEHDNFLLKNLRNY